MKIPKFKFEGRYRLVVSQDAAMLEVRTDSGEFHNLITDTGLDLVGSVNTDLDNALTSAQRLMGRVVVGSGNTTPAYTDTTLANRVAIGSREVSLTRQSSNYARGYYEITVEHQFRPGEAVGTLAEVGMQHRSGPLWSRALILDPAGSPTAITVLPEDYLTVYYTLRVTIPDHDFEYEIPVTRDGGDPIVTAVTVRPLNANSASTTGGWGLNTAKLRPLRGFTGGLAIPTAPTPLGTDLGRAGSTADVKYTPYINGSYTREVVGVTVLANWNDVDISTLEVDMLMGIWQANFDPPLRKNSTETFTIGFGYSWGRADQ